MEIPMSEVIDRMTVLKLKVLYGGGESAKKELDLHEEAIEEFEANHGKVNPELIEDLQKANLELWNLVSELNEEKKAGADLRKLGEIYIRQHIANKKRIILKNKIAEQTGSGFKDVKVNSDLKDEKSEAEKS